MNETNTKQYPKPDFYKVNGSKITIRRLKFIAALQDLGFRRLDYKGKILIIRDIENIIEEYSPVNVTDVFVEYLENLDETVNEGDRNELSRELLIDKIYAGLDTYFSQNFLKRLKREPSNVFLEDTKDSSFFFYRNRAVKVTKDAIEFIRYENLGNKKIWKNQILDRDIKVCDMYEIDSFNFTQFVKNISGTYEKGDIPNRDNRFDKERYQILKTIIGYSLNNYFGGKKKAIIFTDSELGEDANGRTGKTLIVKSMGKMLNSNTVDGLRIDKRYVELNGKEFSPEDRFKYQELRRESKLVHINDARKNLNFELLFNDITEGIKAQRKNAEPFAVQAKIIVSTNQTIKIHGDSAKDRCIEFEMSNYYSAQYSPEMEFKERFFENWDARQWQLFDNFMFICIQDYFRFGIKNPTPINLNERKLLNETSKEFIEFIDGLKKIDGLGESVIFPKSKLHSDFVRTYPDFRKVRQNTFTKWCKRYAEYRTGFKGVRMSGSGSSNIEFISINGGNLF